MRRVTRSVDGDLADLAGDVQLDLMLAGENAAKTKASGVTSETNDITGPRRLDDRC